MFKPRPWFLIGMVLLAVALRLVPWFLGRFFGMSTDPQTSTYPWNFSPLPAICLFGAAFYQDRRLSYLVPLSAYLLGDLGIGLLSGNMKFAFYANQPMVYGSFILMITIGFYMRKNRSVWAVGGTSFLGALLFFLITNFGVWALGNGMLYPHSISGLIKCYTMALPYFRNSLIGMMVFVPVLFSRLALVEYKLPSLQPVPVTAIK
jgi:hypothetical protein